MGKQSWKDICNKVAGPEEKPVVYDFSRDGSGKGRKFREPVEQDGQGVYNDGLIDGGVEGE